MRSEPNTGILLRDVEAGDLPLFFGHQLDPVAVEMVAFRSRGGVEFDQHWARSSPPRPV